MYGDILFKKNSHVYLGRRGAFQPASTVTCNMTSWPVARSVVSPLALLLHVLLFSFYYFPLINIISLLFCPLYAPLFYV